MGRLGISGVMAALAVLLAGCAHAPQAADFQPIIDMHRHTPWPGDDDAAGLALIREELRAHDVVAAALFITGREDVARYTSNADSRLLLSPMFPCPALTADRKWCFREADGPLPDAAWLDRQLADGALVGIGELVFNYAAMAPDDPAMAPFWALAARHDVPAFVHTGRGPAPEQGPRRHPGCCPDYDGEYGNPALLRPVLARHASLRIVLQHVGFDFLDETLALMRDHPGVYADMSVLNSVGQRGIYYDNAARFLRFDAATIAADYGRGR